MRAPRLPLASPRTSLLSTSLLLLPLLLAGCSGSDGAAGPAGPAGPPGPPGGSGVTDTELDPGQDPPGIQVAIVSLGGASGGNGAFQVGDHISVTFTVTAGGGVTAGGLVRYQ